MRVIAGSAKGTRLAPVPPGVRPVSDRAREGLFSSLGAAVAGARTLDLFAGTGALAIEALSRGAEHAVLVERDKVALQTIRENLVRTRFEGMARTVPSSVDRYLRSTPDTAERFDLVFVDPPYAADAEEVGDVLGLLGSSTLLAGGFTVVLTRGHRSSTPVVPLHWAAARCLEYGDTLVTLYREV
jgi:16S rRNA (guanine(966)-N(2))-methyltransferase RsmD